MTNAQLTGITLRSPYLSLKQTVVKNTGGYGFKYQDDWFNNDYFVVKMADSRVRKRINLCHENSTFLGNSSVAYYLQVESEPRRTCQCAIEIGEGLTFGIQLLHHTFSSNFPLKIYNGTNTSSSQAWEVHRLNWQGHPTWRSGSRSILLQSSSWYYTSVRYAYFIIYLIEGKNFLCSRTLIY